MAITKEEYINLTRDDTDVEKVSKISSDGVNMMSRIPKDIVGEMLIKKGDEIKWTIKDGELKIEYYGKKKKEDTT